MTFTYEDQTVLKLRDTIVSFSADNLAAWSVGGSLYLYMQVEHSENASFVWQ